MSLQSMTGFARHSGEFASIGWVWELKSVNGKSLDLRFRLPHGFEELEAKARKSVAKQIARGNMQINLALTHREQGRKPVINHEAIMELAKASKQLTDELGGEPPKLADILAIRGVVEMEETSLDETTRKELLSQLLNSFDNAVAELVAMRKHEGKAMGDVVSGQIKTISELVDRIDADGSRSADAIRERLTGQLEKIIADHDSLDPQRLHQEAAFLAAKADVQEELDRLKAHVVAARELIAEGGPIGRKLDFLCQEFNRECNTICSKSNAASVSAMGLDMKLVIDQFREQVQNLE